MASSTNLTIVTSIDRKGDQKSHQGEYDDDGVKIGVSHLDVDDADNAQC